MNQPIRNSFRFLPNFGDIINLQSNRAFQWLLNHSTNKIFRYLLPEIRFHHQNWGRTSFPVNTKAKRKAMWAGFCRPKMRVDILTTPTIFQIELSLDFHLLISYTVLLLPDLTLRPLSHFASQFPFW